MIDESEGFASAAAELGLSLLDAKLSVPRTRPGAVSRAPLIQTARESDRRVVGVTAPAGYGKSTLLAEWARTEDRPVAWVSLDSFDDDPAAFLFSLASAYGRITPDGEGLIADVGGLGVSVLGRAAPRLASAFRTSPQPFVLMLDDLHEVRSPACHDALGVAIAGIPPGSQFVAASRDEQPHLPRLRAEGDAMEFGARRPGPRRGRRAPDLRGGADRAQPADGGSGDRAHRGLARGPVPRCADRERDLGSERRRSPGTIGTSPTTSTASRSCSCPRTFNASCGVRRCWTSSVPRSATRSSRGATGTRSFGGWRPRTCS